MREKLSKIAWRRWLPRAAGSIVILGLLFWFLPVATIIDGFSRVPFSLFLGVVVVFLIGHVAAAAKWWNLMDRELPFSVAIRAHFAGLASNLCLPGAAGGDAVRAGIAQFSMKDGAKVISAAVGDRLIDMLGLACLSVFGILLLQADGDSTLLAFMALILMVAVVVFAVYLLPWAVPIIWKAIPKLPARGLAERTADSLRTLGRRPGLLAVSFVASVTIQTVFIMLTVQLAAAIGVGAPTAVWFFAWPLAKILAVLPVSLNGLGVREATLAGLLLPFGTQASEVVATGLVWQAVLFVSGGLGALVLAASGLKLGDHKPQSAKLSE